MSDPYISEIRMFAGNFAPRNWALCDGQVVAISQNQALFALLGTMYGGDGQTNFYLPDMRGRLPLHFGQALGGSLYVQGRREGVETVTLNAQHMPSHNHALNASSDNATDSSPENKVYATTAENQFAYNSSVTNAASLNPQAIGNTGGTEPHSNLMPSLAISFIISLAGTFPSRN